MRVKPVLEEGGGIVAAQCKQSMRKLALLIRERVLMLQLCLSEAADQQRLLIRGVCQRCLQNKEEQRPSAAIA